MLPLVELMFGLGGFERMSVLKGGWGRGQRFLNNRALFCCRSRFGVAKFEELIGL